MRASHTVNAIEEGKLLYILSNLIRFILGNSYHVLPRQMDPPKKSRSGVYTLESKLK